MKAFENAPKMFLLTNELPDNSEWIDKSKIFNWSEVQDIVLDKEAKVVSTSGRLTGSYDIYRNEIQEIGIPANDLKTENLFYIHHTNPAMTRWNRYDYDPTPFGVKQIFHLHPDATLVILGANRIAKFNRDFPNAKELRTYLKTKALEWKDNSNKHDRIAHVIQDERRLASIRILDRDSVDDPDLKEMIGLSKRNIKSFLTELELWKGLVTVDSFARDWDNPLKKYALLANLDLTYLAKSAISDLYIYLNAAYAATKEEVEDAVHAR
jgi:hypothetical protein